MASLRAGSPVGREGQVKDCSQDAGGWGTACRRDGTERHEGVVCCDGWSPTVQPCGMRVGLLLLRCKCFTALANGAANSAANIATPLQSL